MLKIESIVGKNPVSDVVEVVEIAHDMDRTSLGKAALTGNLVVNYVLIVNMVVVVAAG